MKLQLRFKLIWTFPASLASPPDRSPAAMFSVKKIAKMVFLLSAIGLAVTLQGCGDDDDAATTAAR